MSLIPAFSMQQKPFNDACLSQSFQLEQYSAQTEQYYIHCDDVVFESKDILCIISHEHAWYHPLFWLVYTECKLHSTFTLMGSLGKMRSRSKCCWRKKEYWAFTEIREKSGSTEPWLGHLPNVNNSMKSWYFFTFLKLYDYIYFLSIWRFWRV